MIAFNTRRLRRLSVLLLLMMTFSSFPGATLAQKPVPPTPPPTDNPPHNAEVYSKLENGERVLIDTTSQPSSAATPALEVNAADAVTSDAPATLLDPAAAPIYAARPEAAKDVLVDVSVPGTVRAGETLDYTYAYTNTTSTTRNVTLQVSWTNFSSNFNGNWQFCLNSGPEADCAPISVAGVAVTKLTTGCPSGKLCYQINGLPGSSSGKFNVRLGVNKDRFPRTGEEIRRPASSVQLLVDAETTVTSEDTAATLIVGPVLVPTKVVAEPGKKIYPTIGNDPAEYGTFNIALGNATDVRDIVNGQVRVDARPATNIVLVDRFPDGGAFISSVEPAGVAKPVVDPTAKTVTWTIPGPLNPGQDLKGFSVTFRKADEDRDCDRLNNAVYFATSAEYPLDGSERFNAPGRGIDIPVIVPVRIEFKATPGNPYYGETSNLEITVRNFYNKALTGAKLNYTIQTNATYLGGANPTPISAPPANQGGTVSWTFDMPAGTKDQPTEKVFSLTIRGGFGGPVNEGAAQVVLPADVPSACVRTIIERANFEPRLLVTKTTDADPETRVDGIYIVRAGQEFEFIVRVENRGGSTATDVDLLDKLPSVNGANFSYKVGSSRINGQVRNPDSFINGREGNVVWNDLSVAGGQTLEIRYVLFINGFDFLNYCNLITARSGNSQDEAIAFGQSSVCLKINPQIAVTKTINGSTEFVDVEPGAEVTFKLTITNRESKTYNLGLADKLNGFEFTGMVSGYDMAPRFDRDFVLWKLVDLAPGQTLEVVFKARVPTECVSREYFNEVQFQSINTPGYTIVPIPRVEVRARVNCGKVEFRKDVNTDRVSLEDRLVYTLKIRNADGKPVDNVQVEDVLPRGFTFVGMESGSAVTSAPQTTTLPDERLQLTWKLDSIKPNTEVLIRYVARSGIIVGRADREIANLLRTIPGICPGDCVSYGDNLYTFRSVEVLPLITAEPKITPDTCATPGDKRIYQVTIVNTNDHPYTQTNVALKLPLGLNFVRALESTPSPAQSINQDGDKILTWGNMIIPAKPDNAIAAQVQLQVELQIGNVWGDLPTQVQSTSPDGAIPRKDGAVDPVIPVCPTKTSIAKDASTRVAQASDEVIYQISVANPTDQPIQGVAVEDQLPDGLTFVRSVAGPAPTQSGNKLTWSVDVPAAQGPTKPGVVILKFRAKIPSGAVKGTEYTNTATANSFDPTYNSVTIKVVVLEKTYLPLVGVAK